MGLLMERWMADPLTQCLGKCTHSELVDPGEWRVALNSHIQSTPPAIPPLSGLTKKRRYWKTVVKWVIYNQEKHIQDLKISGNIGGCGQRRGGIGGTVKAIGS